jgi:hypothetical protein
MYVVKWPAYEFCFFGPKEAANRVGEERPLLQVRFKDQGQLPGLVPEVGQMEDFFEELTRVL